VQHVSCRALGVVLKAASRNNVPEATITEGTPYALAHLRNAKNRIEWDVFVRVLSNLRHVWTLEEMSDLNEAFMRSPFFSYVGVVARLLFTSRDLFDWICKRNVGGGAQLFSDCVKPSYHHIGDRITVITLEIQEPYATSPEFFWMTRGAFIAMPRLVGAGSADVTLSIEGRVGTFTVSYRNKRGTLAGLFRLLAWPFTARAAARELQRTNEELQSRFLELETARAKLADYQVNLEQLVEQRTAELSEARDALAQNVVQLREAQGARERFFGNVSHEIRTPLTLIMLAASDIARRQGHELDERAAESLGAINDAARKLVRLVDELLLLAAGQEGKLAIHREPTDLAALARSVVAAWRPAAERADIALTVEAPPTLIAMVDPVAFERVVSNLVSNAVKFTPKAGAIALELARGGAEDARRVQLAVRDTGPGIDPELAQRLFGRFERSAGTERKIAGTGIGLALVKQLIEAHGGSVSAHARDSGGTEMRVVLPEAALDDIAANPSRRAAPASDVVAVPAAGGVSSGQQFTPDGFAAGTILVAEDDAALAEQIALALCERYAVTVALDGVAALELARAQQPQLLITDVDMPGLDGISLSREFRAATGDKVAPIIILSAVLDPGTRIEGLDAGAIDYVTKPFDPRELIARVDAQFRMRELVMRLQRAEQLSSMGILTSGLAHELRNPANAIVNAVEPLSLVLPPESVGPNTPAGQLLAVLATCANQVLALSRQLLGFRSGGIDIDHQRVGVATIVDQAMALTHTALTDIRTTLDISPGLVVSGSQSLLVQVMTNLVENAAHAAGKGGRVEIRGVRAGGRITVEVADSGRGVPVELRERVFEAFFTTKAPGVGTGLGLPLARTIAHRHGGVLEIRERAGRCVFVLELPDENVGETRAAPYNGQEVAAR